eukprot:804364-Pyramimonas_sp.AAC.1
MTPHSATEHSMTANCHHCQAATRRLACGTATGRTRARRNTDPTPALCQRQTVSSLSEAKGATLEQQVWAPNRS